MNNELRDPFEKVSNSLRRAVNVNKTRESDLRSKVSTIQKERRQSMNSWSLKQEKFLTAKLKMMPAIKLGDRHGRDEVFPRTRKVTLTRGAMPPVTMEQTRTIPNSPAEKQSGKSSSAQSDLQRLSKYPNPLPPVVTSSMATEVRPQGFYMQQGGKLDNPSTTDHELLNKLPKKRRITEYKSPVHQYLYGNREEEQRQAIRHRLSVHELQNAASLARKVSCYGTNNKMDGITEEFEDNNEGSPNTSEPNQPEQSPAVPSISAILPKEEEHGNKRAMDQWRKIRESLSTIVGRQKKKDIGKMSMLELTSLFEGIRDCRYLRVGNHTSYRGDSEDSKHCRCIACTVSDKTKLRNNLSAPE